MFVIVAAATFLFTAQPLRRQEVYFVVLLFSSALSLLFLHRCGLLGNGAFDRSEHMLCVCTIFGGEHFIDWCMFGRWLAAMCASIEVSPYRVMLNISKHSRNWVRYGRV